MLGGLPCLGDRVACHRGGRRHASWRAAGCDVRMRFGQIEPTEETYVVSSIRVVVDTTEERGRGVLADELDQKMATTGVLVHEVGHVVDESSEDDNGTLGSLLLD